MKNKIFKILLFSINSLVFSSLFITFSKFRKMILSLNLLEKLGPKSRFLFILLLASSFLSLYWADKKHPFKKSELFFIGLPGCFIMTILLNPRNFISPQYFDFNHFLAASFIALNSIIAGIITWRLDFSLKKSEKFFNIVFYLTFCFFIFGFSLIAALKLINAYKAYDISLYFQAMFNTLKGNFLHATCAPAGPSLNFLGVHFSPILALIAPLYLVFPSALTFIILLVIVEAIGALPLKSLAKKVLNNSIIANLVAVSYLAFIPLSSVMLFGFREIALAIPLVIFAFYFLENGQKGLFFLFSILAISCKEEMILVFFLVGIFLFVFKKEKILGFLLILICGLLGPIYSKIIMPLLWGGKKYSYWNKYFGNIFAVDVVIKRILSLRSFQYLIFMFSPMLGMAFLSGGYLLIFLPVLIITFLSQNPLMASIYFHYSGSLIPFVFIASIYGFRLFKPFSEKFIKFAVGYIIINIVITNLFFAHHFLRLNFNYKGCLPHPNRMAVLEAKKNIPKEAAVLVDDDAGPSLAFRKKYYIIFDPKNIRNHKIFLEAKKKVEYIVIFTGQKNLPYLNNLAEDRNWGVIFFKNNLLLLKKEAPGPKFNYFFIKKIRGNFGD